LFASIRAYYSQSLKCTSRTCEKEWAIALGKECPGCARRGVGAVELGRISAFLYEVARVVARGQGKAVARIKRKILTVIENNSSY
jgi:hypothetical protein